jgi:hypothetical protein
LISTTGKIEKVAICFPIQGVVSCGELDSKSMGLTTYFGSYDAFIWGCQVEWLDEDVGLIAGVEAHCGVTGEVFLSLEGNPPSQPLKTLPMHIHYYAETKEL